MADTARRDATRVTQFLSGRVDIRGLTTQEARQEALRSELRSKIPLGWRIVKHGNTFRHTRDNSEIVYRVVIEPQAARSRQ